MKRLRNAAVVIIVMVLTLSVSVFASDKTSTIQPLLHLASADQPAETGHAKATLHEAGGTDATQHTSGSDHGQGHPNLGETLPLWSCIPFAGIFWESALTRTTRRRFPCVAICLVAGWHIHKILQLLEKLNLSAARALFVPVGGEALALT